MLRKKGSNIKYHKIIKSSENSVLVHGSFGNDVYMHIIKGITVRITKLGKYQAMKSFTRREQKHQKHIYKIDIFLWEMARGPVSLFCLFVCLSLSLWDILHMLALLSIGNVTWCHMTLIFHNFYAGRYRGMWSLLLDEHLQLCRENIIMKKQTTCSVSHAVFCILYFWFFLYIFLLYYWSYFLKVFYLSLLIWIIILIILFSTYADFLFFSAISMFKFQAPFNIYYWL